MRFGRILLSSTVLLAVAAPAFALTHARRSPTSPKLISKRPKATAKHPGQAGIEPQRATEIQTALIKSGYLSGEPSGTWDAASQAAMQKLQADNGWQTKLVPDSRAIIKLGLGPAQDNVAIETSPPPPQCSPATNSTAPSLSDPRTIHCFATSLTLRPPRLSLCVFCVRLKPVKPSIHNHLEGVVGRPEILNHHPKLVG